jgi:hypothetical protein
MKRLTPSMCHEPSGCGTALVRPAPTSEPASGSVSTMVEAHRFSANSWAHFFCSGVPSCHSVCAKEGPEAYIQTGALAPRTSSASDHQKIRGAGVPPSSVGRSSRQNSLSMKAWYDRRKLSGIVTVCVSGSKTGGFRSPSA